MKSIYRNPLFRRLAEEIMARTPTHERFAPTRRAEDLLFVLDKSATRPYSYYYGRIARVQPDSAPDAQIPAEDARQGRVDHADFPTLLAEAMDTLAALGYDHGKAAAALGVTASQLIKLLKKEPEALAIINQSRSELNMHTLR